MGIPLVALAVRDQQFQDPIATQGRLMSLQALGQQTQQAAALAPGEQQIQQQRLQLGQQAIQQGQFAVQDREAGMKAMQQWDGKDPNQLPDLIQKNGGSLDAVINARKGVVASQQSVLSLNTAQLAQNKAKNDYLLGKLQAASGTDIPDAQLAPGIVNAAQESVKDGYLQPEEAQKLQQLVQQYPDPKDLRSQLSIYEKGLQGQSTQFSQEQENRKTAAAEQQAQARATAANTSAAEFQAKMPGGPLADPARAEMQDWLTKNPGKGPSDFLAYKASLGPQAQVAAQGGVGGGLSGPALDQAAARYAQTGVLPSMGMGAAGSQARKAIMNRAGELAPNGSIAANSAEYKANENSLTSLQKNFDQVTGFENTAGKNLNTFLATAQKLEDTGSPWLNKPWRDVQSGLAGSPDLAAYNAARTTAITEIAKVLTSSNASGVLSDSARGEVSGLIGPNATLGQIQSAAKILKQDMANRHDAYQQQIQDIKGRLGGSQSAAPSGESKFTPPPNAPTATGPNGHKIVAIGGKWVDAQTGAPI